MKNEKTNLTYSTKDERGFLVEKKKTFSNFLEAIKYVRENQQIIRGKPIVK